MEIVTGALQSLLSHLDRLHTTTYGAATGALGRASVDLAAAPTALLLAFALGMVHALMPGHGKTVVFTYFLSGGARLASGVGMALKIAALHVGTAVFLLLVIGTTVVRFGRLQGPGRLLEIASYATVTLIGVWLLYRALAHRPRHGVEGGGHRHGRTGFLGYAVGLLPCPLTIILLNYALVNQTLASGLVLVGVMALGIAATMSLIGVGAILTRRVLTGGTGRASAWFLTVTRVLEVAGAATIFLIGLLNTSRSV